MSLVRLTLLLCIALAMPVSAQKAKPSGKVSVQLLAGSVPEGLGKVFLQTESAKSAEFDLPTATLSEPVTLSARSMALMTVGKEAPLCKVTLPTEGKSFAVLLAPEKPEGYVPFLVRLDDQSFKAGDVFLINRSEKAVVLKLGGNEVVIEAGKSVTTRPTEPVDGAYFVTISERNAAGDKLITSTRWPMDDQLRSYLFFSTNEKGKTVYRAIDEYLAPGGTKKKR
jgi:hypothetical protein